MRISLGNTIQRVAALSFALAVTGFSSCASSSQASRASAAMSAAPNISLLQGVATYREKIALPPDAVFEAVLQEVAAADAPPIDIAHTTEDQATTPIRFSISFDESRIDPAKSYVVRATISVNGQPWFSSDQPHPVLTQGAGRSVEMMMRMVRDP
ncbi:MAG TPA: YbaY family lipoprotein [Gemmatimonadales bacterium]|nr:YbaY family lipoprotein [Gemmatimonadales bacterium]